MGVVALLGAGCSWFGKKEDPFKVTQPPTTSIATDISPAEIPTECMPSSQGERVLGDAKAYATDEGFCFQYDPALGKYTATTMTVLRIAGALLVVAFGTFLALSLRRERRGRAQLGANA